MIIKVLIKRWGLGIGHFLFHKIGLNNLRNGLALLVSLWFAVCSSSQSLPRQFDFFGDLCIGLVFFLISSL
jgi:hypothetical protein